MQHIQRCTGVLCLAKIHAGPQKGFTNCDSEVVYNCIHGWHGQLRIENSHQLSGMQTSWHIASDLSIIVRMNRLA